MSRTAAGVTGTTRWYGASVAEAEVALNHAMSLYGREAIIAELQTMQVFAVITTEYYAGYKDEQGVNHWQGRGKSWIEALRNAKKNRGEANGENRAKSNQEDDQI
jgi:hypothetical protein